MSAKYSGPDDWTIFHIADDREAYSLKNSATAHLTSKDKKKKDDKDRARSDKPASSSSSKQKKSTSSSK